ncbi:MAG TPA: VOC family protein [Acidimicrobiales bacterium]|nr:VOC family protein [Acidimicrobiales bacterium]
MLTGFAHAAICVADVDEATRWYSEVLGLRVLSPPYQMTGAAIERDMGELLPSPVLVKAAIVGLGADDHVLELIEYPQAQAQAQAPAGNPAQAPAPAGRTDRPVITNPGLTHVGLVCDDIVTTRAELEGRGVGFLTSEIAEVAGLRTTWFRDPWGTVLILLEKRHLDRPYWGQYP